MINDAGELCPSIASQPLGFLLIFNSYINYIIYIYIYIYIYAINWDLSKERVSWDHFNCGPMHES